MEKRVMEVSEEWLWLMSIAEEIKYGEISIRFENGKPAETNKIRENRNFKAEKNRK